MQKTIAIVIIILVAGIAMYYISETDREPEAQVEEPDSVPEPVIDIQAEVAPPLPKSPEEIQQEYMASLNLGDGSLKKSTVHNKFRYKRVKVYLYKKHYHIYGCREIPDGTNYKKLEQVWLEDAIKRGFKPCPYCKRASHSMSRQ